MPGDTIILIHGLWMTPQSWEGWIERYEREGYRVLAPAWPGMEGSVESLRTDPSPIARLGFREIADHYERIIRELDSPPIIIGHSFGGALTQALLDRGLGAAGVALASAPVRGLYLLPLSTLRAALPVLRNPFNRGKAVPLDSGQFHYAFANTVSRAESDAIRERHHVPGAANLLFEGALANFSRRSPLAIDFARAGRAPLLFIAFGEDHISPPSLVRRNAGKYQAPRTITSFAEYPDRPHFPGVPGWEQVADDALAWAQSPSAPGLRRSEAEAAAARR